MTTNQLLCSVAQVLRINWSYYKTSCTNYLNKRTMRLTLINFFKQTVPGHIFRGKRRLVKPVSKRAMETLRRDYERQEQIMLLLRHPYLTVEESSGHTKELKKTELKIAKWTEQQTLSKMKPHVTIAERLQHLKVKEAWD